MTSSKTSAWVSSYLDSKRGANMAVAIKPTEQKQNWGRSDGKAAGKAGGGEHVAAAAGKVSGGSKNEVWLKTPVKDGCFEKNPKTAMRVDKGDSTTFSRYGDYKYGRTIGDGARGPVTARLQGLYKTFVDEMCRERELGPW